MDASGCKGCSASVLISEAEIAAELAALELMPDERAGEETYNLRLALCASCSFLGYGTTCLQCGCLVRVRAIYRRMRCPNPDNSRW